MTPADKLAEAVEAVLKQGHRVQCPWHAYADGRGHQCNCGHNDLASAYRAVAGVTEAYHVTIHGQYDAATCCVTTTHGEPLVAFEMDAGSLAPLDGKAVSVTVRGNQ